MSAANSEECTRARRNELFFCHRETQSSPRSARRTTAVAKCGCPFDPDYDEGYLGWHLKANHPETAALDIQHRVEWAGGNVWFGCVEGAASVHHFTVNQYFAPRLTGPTHMLVCDRCGTHLHAEFDKCV